MHRATPTACRVNPFRPVSGLASGSLVASRIRAFPCTAQWQYLRTLVSPTVAGAAPELRLAKAMRAPDSGLNHRPAGSHLRGAHGSRIGGGVSEVRSNRPGAARRHASESNPAALACSTFPGHGSDVPRRQRGRDWRRAAQGCVAAASQTGCLTEPKSQSRPRCRPCRSRYRQTSGFAAPSPLSRRERGSPFLLMKLAENLTPPAAPAPDPPANHRYARSRSTTARCPR